MLISKDISEKVLMIGVEYKNNAPGGMASVVNSYAKFFYKLNYISTWKFSNHFTRLYYAIKSIIIFTFTLILNNKIKIVHIHGAANNSFYRKRIFINISAFFNKKIVYHMHGSQFQSFYENSNRKELIVKTINKCDKMIVLSKSWKDFFLKIGISQDKILILNNIVDLPNIDNIKNTNKLLTFLFLGEIGNRKGIFDLLEVINTNRDVFQGKIILRIGGNGEMNRIIKFISENNLSDLVHFLGWVSGKQKVEELNCADIYILPSYNEGLPISILEAESYKLPIISTSVGGIPEVVEHLQNGYLIHPGNLSEIKEAMIFFMNNQDKIEKFGARSSHIASEFYPTKGMPQLYNLYKNLL